MEIDRIPSTVQGFLSFFGVRPLLADASCLCATGGLRAIIIAQQRTEQSLP